MTKKVYTRDILDCNQEAKKTLHKKYNTDEVVALTLKLWRASIVEKEIK